MSSQRKSHVSGEQDGGPSWVPINKNAASADITTALDITNPPTAATKSIVIDDLIITSEVAQDIYVRDSTPTTLLGPLYVAAGGILPFTLRNGITGGAVNKKLQIVGTLAGNVKAYCSYHEITPAIPTIPRVDPYA